MRKLSATENQSEEIPIRVVDSADGDVMMWNKDDCP